MITFPSDEEDTTIPDEDVEGNTEATVIEAGGRKKREGGKENKMELTIDVSEL